MIAIIPVKDIPEINPGDDLAEIIARKFDFKERDILVICSTVVSKEEGRILKLDDVSPGERAKQIAEKIGKDARFVQAVIDEAQEILLDFPFVLTRTKNGNICVNSGIDSSNVKEGYVLLLPEDPDKSARRIRERLKELTGRDIAVVITDTNGRAFRKGVTGVAIGCSGIKPLRDWRGKKDIHGKELEITVEALIDEIASAGNMVMGEGAWKIPAVVVRGVEFERSEEGIKPVYRDEEEDIIVKAIKSSKKSET